MSMNISYILFKRLLSCGLIVLPHFGFQVQRLIRSFQVAYTAQNKKNCSALYI